MREPVGRVPPPWAMIACSRHRPRWHISPRSQADVSVRLFPWSLTCHLVSIFPRVFKYAMCLFLIPSVFHSCTMIRVERKVAEKPAAVTVEHRVAGKLAALI